MWHDEMANHLCVFFPKIHNFTLITKETSDWHKLKDIYPKYLINIKVKVMKDKERETVTGWWRLRGNPSHTCSPVISDVPELISWGWQMYLGDVRCQHQHKLGEGYIEISAPFLQLFCNSKTVPKRKRNFKLFQWKGHTVYFFSIFSEFLVVPNMLKESLQTNALWEHKCAPIPSDSSAWTSDGMRWLWEAGEQGSDSGFMMNDCTP